MSIEIMSLVFKAAIPTTQKFVLIAIADHCNSEGKGWPSIQRIAAHTSLQTRTVYRAIHDLESWGILSKNHNPHSKSTLYTINKTVLLKPLTNGQMTHDHLTDDHPDTRSGVPLTHDHPTPDTRSPTPLTDDHPNHNTNHKEPSKEPLVLVSPLEKPTTEKPLKEKKAKSEPKATRLPEFFAVGPDETGEWPVPDFYTEFCESLGWTINETFDEALVFRDYWLAVPGPKGKKTDWEATWRNWIRRADETKKEKARRQEQFLERTKPFERNHL